MQIRSCARALGLRLLAVVAVMLLAVPSIGASHAAAEGIFSGLSGNWRGDGSIKYSSGESEGMRCTAQNDVSDDGNKVMQVLTCAFASGGAPLKIKTDIRYSPAANVVTGSWSESSYGASGQIKGSSVRGNRIRAHVVTTARNVTVDVEVTTKARTQTIVMRPTNYEVTEVSVQLRKR